MPRYTYNGQQALVFGDLHYGVNASVDGVTDRDGEAVVLQSGDVVTTNEVVTHAFLLQHDEGESPARGEVTEKKTKAAKGDATVVSEDPTTPADAATSN